MHLTESANRRGRRSAALVRCGWTPPESLTGPVVVAPGRVNGLATPRVDFVLRHRLDLPLALVRIGARADPRPLIEAARACGVPYAYALGRRRVRELELPLLGARGPARERELARVPSPKELWRRHWKRLGLSRAGRRLLKTSLARSSGTRVAEGPCAAAERRTLEAFAIGRRRALCLLPEGLDRSALAARVARRLGLSGFLAQGSPRAARGGGLPRTLVLVPDHARRDELAAAFAAGADETLVLATPAEVELRSRPPVARLERAAFDLIVVDGAFCGAAWVALEELLERDDRALQLALHPGSGGATALLAARFGPALVDATPARSAHDVEVRGDLDPERLLDELGRAAQHVARACDVDATNDAQRVRSMTSRAELLDSWPSVRTRERLIAAMHDAGLDLAQLAARVERGGSVGARASDGLDLLLHVGWGAALVARRERVDRLRRRAPRVWSAANGEERGLLGRVLEEYVAHGLAQPWLPGRLDAHALRALGGASLVATFGEPRRLRKALRRIARALYADDRKSDRGAGPR